MVFGFFKKKKKNDYDPLHITVEDLKKGFVFEYDLDTWIVEEEYTYDWGDNYFTKEFKISSGRNSFYLSVERDDELELSISKKIKIGMIEEDIASEIELNENPPKTIVYKNKTYYKESESPGFFLDENGKNDWEELIAWTYYDEEEKEILSIEQWGDADFEASHGKIIQEFEISNIMPSE